MKSDTATPWDRWEATIQRTTEQVLTWRKRRRVARKARQKRRNPVVDWLDAILSAVVIVLLINQYLLQAYQIPSPSMEPSLLVSDRIFVNKIVYGPELVPGMLKMPGFRLPARGDVIIFESPEYISSGPVMDILQRVVYMVTLSLVDIDKDENGRPKVHFLVKRAIGMPGDRIRMNEGNVEFLPPGESRWIPETELKKALGFNYQNVRLYNADQYPVFKAAAIGLRLKSLGLPTTADQEQAVTQLSHASSWDDKFSNMWDYATTWAVEPDNLARARDWRALKEGYYVPEGSLFPMGDNRDNSRDARYFGPVRLEKVLGKASFRYWPIYRFGGIH